MGKTPHAFPMPKPGCATTKTEFMRYLNENPTAVPSLKKMADSYQQNRYRRGQQFGFWLKLKKPADFDRAYSAFWLKQPKLHGAIYEFSG
jgi:hypothetical protein